MRNLTQPGEISSTVRLRILCIKYVIGVTKIIK
nr:MAG TPA: hypothetical protein [Caudoviricetes sp.]